MVNAATLGLGLQALVLAFAAGGAWVAVKTSAKAAKKLAAEAHQKIDALTAKVDRGFNAVHSRLDSLGARAKADVVSIEDAARKL